jgi:hypothetical protein
MEYHNKGANVRLLMQPAVRGTRVNTGGYYPYKLTFTQYNPIKRRHMRRYGLFDDIDDLIQELDNGGNCLINALLKISEEKDLFEVEKLMSLHTSQVAQG